jgi:hypothetical protein
MPDQRRQRECRGCDLDFLFDLSQRVITIGYYDDHFEPPDPGWIGGSHSGLTCENIALRQSTVQRHRALPGMEPSPDP